MEKKATGEIDWDLEAIKGSQNSWKDEWLVILFSIPMAFFGGTLSLTKEIFEISLFIVLSIAGLLLLINNESYGEEKIIVKKVLVEDGSPVQFGQPLFLVKP